MVAQTSPSGEFMDLMTGAGGTRCPGWTSRWVGNSRSIWSMMRPLTAGSQGQIASG